MPSSTAFSRISIRWPSLLAEEGAFAILFALAILAVRRTPPGRMTEAGVSVVGFLTLFAVSTVVFVALVRAFRSARLLAAFFDLAIIVGVFDLFLILLGPSAAVLAASAAAAARYLVGRVLTTDLILILGLAGVTVEFSGSLQPTGVAIILAVLAIYDIIAVYGTKHMVTMAEALLRQRAVFAIMVPTTPQGWFARLVDVRPGAGFSFLGTGDAVLPAILVASVARDGVAPAVIVAIGAALGLAVTHALFVSADKPKPMPALPPIAAGAILGYLITIL
ncbi:MAG: presenilin family intramembrane aspartyl protease [Patescibacteria group bacterium]